MGKHGLTIDNLLSAEVVTADGQLRKASATEHPDLFWALRGGGGNFGVVTAFEFRLHPVTRVLGGMVIYPLDQAAAVLRFYRDFCPTLPDEAEAYAALLTSPEGIPVAGDGWSRICRAASTSTILQRTTRQRRCAPRSARTIVACASSRRYSIRPTCSGSTPTSLLHRMQQD